MSSKYTAGDVITSANDEVEPKSGSSDTSEGAVIGVTDHAKLRYRQRVDAMAVDATEALRDLFRDGYPAPNHDQVNEGRARQHGDYLVVYTGSESRPTIKTVLRRRSQ
jgi:hypothetical protein